MFYDSNCAYGNGGTNNNGNVYRMTHFLPTNDTATTDESPAANARALARYSFD